MNTLSNTVVKFTTKEVVYFVKNDKITLARCAKTGKFIKRHIAQAIHNKMVNAAKNFNSFVNKNKLQATVWFNQLKTYFKSFGFNVACVDVNGKHGLTLNTFVSYCK